MSHSCTRPSSPPAKSARPSGDHTSALTLPPVEETNGVATCAPANQPPHLRSAVAPGGREAIAVGVHADLPHVVRGVGHEIGVPTAWWLAMSQMKTHARVPRTCRSTRVPSIWNATLKEVDGRRERLADRLQRECRTPARRRSRTRSGKVCAVASRERTDQSAPFGRATSSPSRLSVRRSQRQRPPVPAATSQRPVGSTAASSTPCLRPVRRRRRLRRSSCPTGGSCRRRAPVTIVDPSGVTTVVSTSPTGIGSLFGERSAALSASRRQDDRTLRLRVDRTHRAALSAASSNASFGRVVAITQLASRGPARSVLAPRVLCPVNVPTPRTPRSRR